MSTVAVNVFLIVWFIVTFGGLGWLAREVLIANKAADAKAQDERD